MSFIKLPLTTSSQDIADEAVERLREAWDGWEPNDADMEVIHIETISPMAQDLAEVMTEAGSALFRSYGVKLIGQPYEIGQPARTTVTLTAIDRAGYRISAGTQIEIDSFVFATDEDETIPGGSLQVPEVSVTATESGAAANGLAGGTTSVISARPFLEHVTVEVETSGGSDAEEEEQYAQKLARALQLQARTLVTTRDFVLWALSRPNVGRAYATNDERRRVKVVITDLAGRAASSVEKELLAEDYARYRLVNTVVTITDATYTTITVRYGVVKYPEFTAEDLADRIETMLATYISPQLWGVQRSSDNPNANWRNEPVVRANKLVDLIADVDGVDYVQWVVISGSAGSNNRTERVLRVDFTGTVTGGSYRITVNGQTTATIAYNATALRVREALEALSTVDPGDVEITGGPGPTDMTMTITGQYSGTSQNVSLASAVTGGGTLVLTQITAAVAGNGDFTMPGEVALPGFGSSTGYIQ